MEVCMLYRLLSGSHTQTEKGKNVTYDGGATVESDQQLDKMFVNKFEYIADKYAEKVRPERPSKKTPVVREEIPPLDLDEEPAKEDLEEPLPKERQGEVKEVVSEDRVDYTSKFPSAKKKNLLVFKVKALKGQVGARYIVVPKDDKDNPIHKEATIAYFSIQKYINGYEEE
jgi:hypothetical protein